MLVPQKLVNIPQLFSIQAACYLSLHMYTPSHCNGELVGQILVLLCSQVELKRAVVCGHALKHVPLLFYIMVSRRIALVVVAV